MALSMHSTRTIAGKKLKSSSSSLSLNSLVVENAKDLDELVINLLDTASLDVAASYFVAANPQMYAACATVLYITLYRLYTRSVSASVSSESIALLMMFR